jgi:hypothetical protein
MIGYIIFFILIILLGFAFFDLFFGDDPNLKYFKF